MCISIYIYIMCVCKHLHWCLRSTGYRTSNITLLGISFRVSVYIQFHLSLYHLSICLSMRPPVFLSFYGPSIYSYCIWFLCSPCFNWEMHLLHGSWHRAGSTERPQPRVASERWRMPSMPWQSIKTQSHERTRWLDDHFHWASQPLKQTQYCHLASKCPLQTRHLETLSGSFTPAIRLIWEQQYQ